MKLFEVVRVITHRTVLRVEAKDPSTVMTDVSVFNLFGSHPSVSVASSETAISYTPPLELCPICNNTRCECPVVSEIDPRD